MKITVSKIETDDFHNSPRMWVSVNFFDDKAEEFHNSAIVNVAITKRDVSLSDLKNEAIQTAIDFLKSAISDHS